MTDVGGVPKKIKLPPSVMAGFNELNPDKQAAITRYTALTSDPNLDASTIEDAAVLIKSLPDAKAKLAKKYLINFAGNDPGKALEILRAIQSGDIKNETDLIKACPRPKGKE